MGKGLEQMLYKRITDNQQIKNVLNFIHHQKNANQNASKVPLYTHQTGSNLNVCQYQVIDEDVEHLEFSHAADRNVTGNTIFENSWVLSNKPEEMQIL